MGMSWSFLVSRFSFFFFLSCYRYSSACLDPALLAALSQIPSCCIELSAISFTFPYIQIMVSSFTIRVTWGHAVLNPRAPPTSFPIQLTCHRLLILELVVTYHEDIDLNAAVASSYIGRYHEAKT